MSLWAYRARGTRGELLEGTLEAASADAAATQLLGSGATPVHISERTAARGRASAPLSRLLERGPDLSDLILLSRQLYTLMRAGVPINRAIHGLARSTRNSVLAHALRDVQASLESGRELSTALSRHDHVFPSVLIAMVRVGENTGRLDDAFLRVFQYLEFEKDTRARVQSALRYPVMVLIALVVAVVVINLFVVPAFAHVFQQAHAVLPLPTRVLIATSDLFVHGWPQMLIGSVVLLAGVRVWLQTEAGRLRWDHLKLKLPVIGDIIYRATLSRFARAFSMALAAGVPLVPALTVVARAVDNVWVAEALLRMRNGMERGDSLTRTAATTGLFTPIVLQMFEVGEETGAVDELLAEIAGFFEREVEYDIKNLATTIEPIILAVIASLVLVLALGVFLPMWDLAGVSLHR